MVQSGVGGSDESFISFAFAVVSVILIVLYIPWGISKARGTLLHYRAPKKERATMANPLSEMWESLCFLPRVIRTIAADPAALVAGAKVCIADKVFFLRCVMPKFLRFVIRPRILLPWLWFLLFSSTVYSSLTFDPYSILEIDAKSSTPEIKKAYRALAKRYHPDHNSTEAAREIFVQVRRAYKALVDRDAFEEEEAKASHTFAVGVALPTFLTSREHDGLVLFGLLAVLLVGPVIIWYKFTNNKKLPRLVWHIRFDTERVASFLRLLGVQVDPKYVERQLSRKTIRELLVSLQLVPANIREDFVNPFPLFPDFVQRCIHAEKNATMFKHLGFSEDAVVAIKAAMVANGPRWLAEYEKRLQQCLAEAGRGGTDANGATPVRLLDASSYKATRYLFQQHTIQVDRALTEMMQLMGNSLPSARKLLNLHEEMYDLLDILYTNPSKVNKPVVQKLTDIPQRVSDLVDAIEPEIQVIWQRSVRQQQEMQQKNGGGCGSGGGCC